MYDMQPDAIQVMISDTQYIEELNILYSLGTWLDFSEIAFQKLDETIDTI